MDEIFVTAQKVSKLVEGVDNPIYFMAIMATVFDQWAADHDMTPAQERKLVKTMLGMMAEVHSANGPLPKSKKIDSEN